MTRAFLLFALGVVAAGCRLAGAFACETREDCSDGPIAGVCELDGYCSFPDGDCPSGRRYGDHAPNGIAGGCAPADDPSDGSGAEDSSTSSPERVFATTLASDGDAETSDAETSDADGDEQTSAADANGMMESTGVESSGSTGDAPESSEASSGADDTEPQDCNVLDCESCMDCVGLPAGPCAEEAVACEDANGCTSGVACMEECLLVGSCFDPCCAGDVDVLIDQLVLCRADHCIDACGRYEFLTCG